MPSMSTATASAASHALCGFGASATQATSRVTARNASRALPGSWIVDASDDAMTHCPPGLVGLVGFAFVGGAAGGFAGFACLSGAVKITGIFGFGLRTLVRYRLRGFV